MFIGGQTAHSKSLTFEPIDISNKACPEQRIFLEGEGRKTADVTGEIIYSTDAAYQFMLARATDKLSFELQIRAVVNGDITADQFTVFVTAIGDNPALNTAYATSITLSNTEDFTVKVAYSQLLTNDTLGLECANGAILFVPQVT